MTPSVLRSHLGDAHNLTQEKVAAELQKESYQLFSITDLEETNFDICLSRRPKFGCQICKAAHPGLAQFKNHLTKRHKLKADVPVIRRQHREEFHSLEDSRCDETFETTDISKMDQMSQSKDTKRNVLVKESKTEIPTFLKEIKEEPVVAANKRTSPGRKAGIKSHCYGAGTMETELESFGEESELSVSDLEGQPEEHDYRCIKCQKSCRDSTELQKHLMSCMG